MSTLDDFPRPPEWSADAACAEVGGDGFFPETGDDYAADVEAAVKVCHGCPVMFACAAAALEQGEQHGVWGGLDFGSLAESTPVALGRKFDARDDAEIMRLTAAGASAARIALLVGCNERHVTRVRARNRVQEAA
jgi:WhiB family redox-sensing transcriptional regulator